MEAILCLACGNPIGRYYDAISLMKEILLSNANNDVHVDMKFIDPNVNENLMPIFEALNINKYCCRSQITEKISMHDLMN